MNVARWPYRPWSVFAVTALGAATSCSPAAEDETAFSPVIPPALGAGGTSSGAGATPLPAPLIGVSPGPTSNDPTAADAPGSCLATRSEADVIKEPLDIIVLVDNSLSMADEARSVESNININFASVLADSGIDYRVILISAHRSSNSLLGATSVCVESPLSDVAACPAPEPLFGERFFQYSAEIGSRDSFDVLLETYDGEQKDDFRLAPLGWSSWLRTGAKKVFVEISDDNENMSAQSFLTSLTALAPEQFGADPARPNLVWHSIVGLAEKSDATEPYQPSEPVEPLRCTGNRDNVFNAGATYQDLSRLTGGLRFPICQFSAYDRVFKAIAESVVSTSRIACGFDIPAAPNGQRVELDKIAVSYTEGAGGPQHVFGRVENTSACQPDAFVVGDGVIDLCPQACDRVRSDPGAGIDVLFTCESTLIVR